LGVDCMQTGSNGTSFNQGNVQMFIDFTADMRQHFVIDPLIGKRQQLLLATQLCRMVLKVNNVIIAGSDDNDF